MMPWKVTIPNATEPITRRSNTCPNIIRSQKGIRAPLKPRQILIVEVHEICFWRLTSPKDVFLCQMRSGLQKKYFALFDRVMERTGCILRSQFVRNVLPSVEASLIFKSLRLIASGRVDERLDERRILFDNILRNHKQSRLLDYHGAFEFWVRQ